jgi:hypothetical protein
MQSDGSRPTENDDPADELQQRFAELEAKRTGKQTFAEVMRLTVHRPQTPDGPRTAALNAFLKSVTGTPFERPIWDEYHRRKGLDDDTLAAAAGIARAERLEDPDCCGLWEVWAGFLLPKLERFAGTLHGWQAAISPIYSAFHPRGSWWLKFEKGRTWFNARRDGWLAEGVMIVDPKAPTGGGVAFRLDWLKSSGIEEPASD